MTKKEKQKSSSKDGGLGHLDGVVENIAVLSSAFPDLMSWHAFHTLELAIYLTSP